MTELSRALGRRATLDDIPDDRLDELAEFGFDWIWLLSVWQTGSIGQRISRMNPDWRRDFENTLPDLCDNDIGGSGFAVASYTVHTDLCGDAGLARLRQRLHERGLQLMLDFVPNHTAIDHPWVAEHPEYYIAGTELDLARAPYNYTWVKRPQGDMLMALGRDPYFSGWPDVLQLNYGSADMQEALIGQLRKIASRCDGVRCDMAMLVLPDVFARTWGIEAAPFWPTATQRLHDEFPGFCFMAEVYWDLEWTLQQQGFDYTYDKRLYDRLRDGQARPVREHLFAGLDYQNKMARFMENHDEPRANDVFPRGMHEAAAVITYTTPGLRFFQRGQFEGCKKRVSPHLIRGPDEPLDTELQEFYDRLLSALREPTLRDGHWQLLECAPAWEGNWTSDCFVASAWQGPSGERMLAVVNYAPNQSQCYVRLPWSELGEIPWRLQDHLSAACYDRDGNELRSRGWYLDMPPWGRAIYLVSPVS
jgi:hypothetical protein